MKKNVERECIKALEILTRHEHVFLTNRCNLALLTALLIVKKQNPRKFILIPDQGGWYSFKHYPKFMGFEVKTLKTKDGIIELASLKKALAGNDVAAFLLTSFAGYFAEQPMKEIAKICHEQDCLVIEDASGAVGDRVLCNGIYSDIIVASFSEWKPVNLGYGGFISFNQSEYYDKEIFSVIKMNPEIYPKLLKKLKLAKKRLNFFFNLAKKVKKELKSYDVLHAKKRGLNVVVKFSDEAEKKEILAYCKKKKYEYVICPSYIRVNDKAVSIELKRL